MLVWHEIIGYDKKKEYIFQDEVSLPELNEEVIIQYPDTPPFIGCFKYGMYNTVYSSINVAHDRISHLEICNGIKWARFHEDLPSSVKEQSKKEFIKPIRPFLLLTEDDKGVVSYFWLCSEEKIIDMVQERILNYEEMVISAIEINGKRDIDLVSIWRSKSYFIEEVKKTYNTAKELENDGLRKELGYGRIVLAIDTDVDTTYYINDTPEGFQCDLWEYSFSDLDTIASRLYDEMSGHMIDINAE